MLFSPVMMSLQVILVIKPELQDWHVSLKEEVYKVCELNADLWVCAVPQPWHLSKYLLPHQLEMEDEDTIDVFQQQTGGLI